MIANGPLLGATDLGWGTLFHVWAPDAERVEVVLENPGSESASHAMKKSADGYFSSTITGVTAGGLYRYRVDGMGTFPDPASRFQPHGVHGPSQIVNPAAFPWKDGGWTGLEARDLIFYELHIGTFTPEGTFKALTGKLPALKTLGVTAIEIMPVADFAGDRNWGYDGVALFAPARCYGTPDDLRNVVNAAHELGLAVVLDVVYNHLGPDGAYHSYFSPYYTSAKHRTPWGDSLNFDGAMSTDVRDFFVENAVRWVREYHLDGLRLDATHAIVDTSPRHIMGSISSAVRAAVAESGRIVHLISEDVRNMRTIVESESLGGWGLDAVWSDDFHHQMRKALTGDDDGYFKDFDGSTAAIAETARKGWFYSGQYAPYFGKPRGSDPKGLEYSRFVFFVQNHDQVGNRAVGDRLHHVADLAAYRASCVLLLLLPETPLLFMGQEWAATTPFLFFTNHSAELGKLVTEGRRQEFRRFEKFADPAVREQIPDPQASQTFEASRLDWEERRREPHASVLRLVTALLKLRREDSALYAGTCSGELAIEPIDENVLALRLQSAEEDAVLAVVRLRAAGSVALSQYEVAATPQGMNWQCILTTEDDDFAPDRAPLKMVHEPLELGFSRPGAAVFRIGKDVHA